MVFMYIVKTGIINLFLSSLSRHLICKGGFPILWEPFL